MNKKILACSIVAFSAFALLSPSEAFSTTAGSSADPFGSSAINEQANQIKNFLFGPALRIAGVFGGGYGMLMAAVTSRVQPLLTYGGIGLGANLIPAFIDSVFVAGTILL